jgi:hypothetical protein
MLLLLNRRALPDAIKIRSYRVAALVWSTAFFGVAAALIIWQQITRFMS